ncbi:membrane fusion protein, multidrug efflux system [Acinetobacter marinus]|uniref:Membrane fusion protein, multidrug efflux system n=1 Tax=Acinetobacter marinus TaxID=281375 RepID=A0A1G6J8G7_9GAMM|nr:efflux RND transporter periplasmic adaptor subunit [Acinetobacter marinus]SDC14929.1 membrane fusion protein, multidrug efflux system [Acinetobacter marinus]
MNRSHFQYALLTAFLLSSPLFLSACSKEEAPAMMNQTPEVGVQVIQYQSMEMKHTLAGRVTAYMTSDVRPQVGGIIQKRLFKEGDYVKAGQPLYQLDSKSYQAAYDSAKADLAEAEASLISDQPKVQRYRNLMKIEAISKQDLADAEATLKQSQASVMSAQAALNTAKINLGYTTVRAPISGRIATSTYTPGALVTADQDTALTTIEQINPVYVDITLSSTELLSLRKQIDEGKLQSLDGKVPVKIILEDGSYYDQSGTLEFVGSSVDTGTGTVTLRALVPNPKYLILPGAYVKAELPMAVNHQAILIPQKAVTRNHKGDPVVKLVGKDGKVEERVIDTTDTLDNQWIVNGGLKQGEKLIIEGASTVSAGDSVKTVLAQVKADTEASAASSTSTATSTTNTASTTQASTQSTTTSTDANTTTSKN